MDNDKDNNGNDRFAEFMDQATKNYIAHSGEIRFGQALSNVLYDFDMDVYNDMRDSDSKLEPFFDDSRISAFLSFVSKRLNRT